MSQSFLGLEKVEISFGDPTNNVVCVCWGGVHVVTKGMLSVNSLAGL